MQLEIPSYRFFTAMIIVRYVSKEVFRTLLAVTLVLLLAFLSQQVVRYLNYAAIGKIPTNILLKLVGFEIPYLLSFLLPLGFYLGILLSYGRLHADNEMSILQMSGFGRRRLMRLTLVMALVICSIVLFLMLWLNPLISTKRQAVMASDAATLHLIQTLIPGRFQVSPDGHHVMYVEKLSRDHERAKNVFLAQEKKDKKDDAQKRWTLVTAGQGYQIKDSASEDQFFVTTDGYRYEGVPGQNDYSITRFKKYWVRIPPTNVRVNHQENETLSSMELLHAYDQPKRAAELQWRISIGISGLLLALLAVPMSAVRPRQGRFLVFLPAIVIYIVYIHLLFIARHWVEQKVVPIHIGIWWVHLVMLVITGIILSLGYKRKGFKSS